MDWLQALLTGVGRLLGSIADAIGADYARAGMITVGLYALAFILFGAWKYQQALAIAFQRGADGMFHLRPLLRLIGRWLAIPAIFVVVGGSCGTVWYGQCASEDPGYCTSTFDDMCLEPGDCDGVTVRDSETRAIRTLPTLANAFGKETMLFQAMLFGCGVIAVPIALLVLIWRMGAAVVHRIVQRLARVPIRF